ncbi:MAG: hypothetical protein K2G69_02980, partial [Muribaculaceae bacterium]|nr:hypothetical protein [Muribaculaceae bacterium]
MVVPADAQPESIFNVGLSHGVVYRLDGSQDAVATSDGRIKISPFPDTLPDSADFIISSVETDEADVMPGDMVSFRWSVENVGNLPAEGGWSEALFLTSKEGKRVMIGNAFYDGNALRPGETVSRSATVVIPSLPGLSGKLNAGVTLIPYLESDEALRLQANNTSVGSGYPVNLGKKLYLILPQTLTEGEDTNIRGQLSRSGSWGESETFTLSTDIEDDRLVVPSTVIIPREQSAAWFQITLRANDMADPAKNMKITAEGGDYGKVEAVVGIIDSHLPEIELETEPDEAMEGEKVKMTATIPFPREEEVVLNLATSHSGRVSLPPAITIPAGSTSSSVEIEIKDNSIVDGHQNISISATAEGYDIGETYLLVIDDDMPALEMQLSPDEVSENAGALAVRGVVTRTSNIDKRVTLMLITESAGQIFFPRDKVVLEAGEKAVEFTVGVYDNNNVDGSRDVDVTAAVFISSCSCTSAGGQSGSVSKTLRILDDDGPSLTLLSTQSVVSEGGRNGIEVTVKRNADLDRAIEVKLSCDTPGSLTLPETVIIPQNCESATFTVKAPLNNETDDDRTVVVSANAVGYTPSNLWVMVTDRTFPDSRITSISVSEKELVAGGSLDVTFTLASGGLLPLPAQTCIGIYADDQQLTRIWLQEPLAPGEKQVFTRSVPMPARTGIVNLYAVANSDNGFKEMNSSDNNSEKIPVTLLSPFKAGIE